MRPVLAVQHRKAIAEGTFDLERSLAVNWRELNDEAREKYQMKYEDTKKAAETDKDASGGRASEQKRKDEDVEMGDETEAETGADVTGGGFTAVNRP